MRSCDRGPVGERQFLSTSRRPGGGGPWGPSRACVWDTFGSGCSSPPAGRFWLSGHPARPRGRSSGRGTPGRAQSGAAGSLGLGSPPARCAAPPPRQCVSGPPPCSPECTRTAGPAPAPACTPTSRPPVPFTERQPRDQLSPPIPPPPPPGVCWRAPWGGNGRGTRMAFPPCRRSSPCRPRPLGPGGPRRRLVRGRTHRLAPLAAEADGLGHHLAAGDVVHLEPPWWCASCGELLLLSLLVAVATLHQGWLNQAPHRATYSRGRQLPGSTTSGRSVGAGRRGRGGLLSPRPAPTFPRRARRPPPTPGRRVESSGMPARRADGEPARKGPGRGRAREAPRWGRRPRGVG